MTSYPADEYTNSSAWSTYGVILTNNVTFSSIPTGTYSFSFNSVRGHQSPAAASTNIISALNNFSTNTYIPYTNSLSVVITGRLTNNVIWSLTSYPNDYTNVLTPGYSFTNDYTLSAIPTGSYTITFPVLSGYSPTNAFSITNNITGAFNPTITGAYVYLSAGTNDSDGDGLPDEWEIKYGLNPYDPTGTNGPSGNVDNDWIPSASQNTPIQLSIDSNNIVYVTFSGNGNPSYPLQRDQLLRHLQTELPTDGPQLGYSKGVAFDNFLECCGLDGYYLTNGPNGTSVPNDDPLTDPTKFDTSGEGDQENDISDGWRYYFWYWRSADARSAGISNSANLSWVNFWRTQLGILMDKGMVDADGDSFYDVDEYFDTWTDPTHCDTDGDGMDDYWEIKNIAPYISPGANSNALDYANNWSNPDADYMAWVTNGILTNGMVGTVLSLGTNVLFVGADQSNPRAAWIDQTRNGLFNLYTDIVLRATSITNGEAGTQYGAHTNYYGTTAGLTSYKSGYPVWVDLNNDGIYGVNDVAIVNPNIKHDGVYRMPPAIPNPGVCSFDPRTAWTNAFSDLFAVIYAAPNTIPYTTYQEYLGGDYLGRLSWNAGGQRSTLNDNPDALNRNSYSNPQNQDTDTDLIPDGWELYTGLNDNNATDAAADSDSDALNNFGEWANATHPLGSCVLTWPNKPWPTDPGVITAPSPNDPHPRDTDWDGLVDGYVQLTFMEGSGSTTTNIGELARLSNPTDVDTDRLGPPFAEGLPDGWEVYAGTDPLVRDQNLDSDHDGLLNWQEYWTGTVPEWMDCDPAWGMKFIARRYMDWNPPLITAPTADRYTTFGSTTVDTRWFMPPDFLTCPSFLYANHVITNLDTLRATFPASSSLDCRYYHTTLANTNNALGVDSTDSDGDGMDDFWEAFHCLNPIRGYRDLVYGAWSMDKYGASLIVGYNDADPDTAGYQVGLQGAPWTSAMELVDYYVSIRILPDSEADTKAAMVIAIVGPHNFGLVGMDPDNDGLPNFEEYTYYRQSHLHTAPSPLWRTDPYAVGVYSFVARNYTRDNTTEASGWNTSGFSLFSGITYSATRGSRPFRWAAMTEGFDTDNDLVNDYDEVTGFRQADDVVASTDPLNDESPLHNRVLWLDGINSWARSYAWSHYGDFSKFSVEAWIRPARLSSAADQVVVEKTSRYTVQKPDGTFTTSALANFQLGVSTNGMPYVLFHNVSGYTTHRAISSRVGILQVGTWAHLAGVFDGTNLTLYVNGESSATRHTTDVPARGIEGNYSVWHPNCNLSVGARETVPGWHFPGTPEKFFAGCIDEVRVWDRILSAGEIRARKDRRLTPAEVGTVLAGNDPYTEGANNLFAYYRFTDLPDPNVEGTAPSEFPTDRPPLSINYSLVYTNYLVIAHDRIRNIPRMPPLDTRVIDGTNISTSASPDPYGISTTNYLAIQLPADFRNSANPYNFTHSTYNIDMGRGMWLCGNAQGLRTNTWLPTLDPDDPDSTDSDGDGLPDWWEQLYGLDIYDATGDNGAWGDPDNDGLNNRGEYLAGTSPRNSDTAGDGIGDYDSRSGPYHRTWGEMYMDGDGMPDIWEMQYGLDPYHYDANLDLDKDGWSNLAEYLAGTDPSNPTSFPQPRLWGSVNYFGNQSGMLNFYVYNTNTMDGVPTATKRGTDSRITATIGTANGTFYFDGQLPVYPLDAATVVTLSAPLGGTNFVTFIFTGPDQYTYSGPGTDFEAGLDYNTGKVALRWATVAVPPAGTAVTTDYMYVNRNAAAFNLQGFKEGDFYLLATMNDVIGFDASKPMGIMEDQPLTMGYSDLTGVSVHIRDSAPGYGRFGWTANTTGAGDYPVVINKISEQNAPTVLTRTMRWSRNFFHEWDYQIAGLYGLPNGHYQWWMNGQQGTFNQTWPASVSTPSLAYPRGEQLNYAVNQLKWTMDVNSTRYHLQVARQSANQSLSFVLDNYYPTPYCDQDGVSQVDLPLYAGELGNGVYYWRVASWSPAGESAWSEMQTFEINLSATSSHWIAGDIYYFGKADSSNIIVEAYNNSGFSGKPEARILLTGVPRWPNSLKGSFVLRGLEAGSYYVRAYLDVTPAGGTRANKLSKPWESWGFIRNPNNNYQPRTILLLDTMFVDGTKLVIRDQDIDNDLLPDAWEMYYFGNLNQTGDMDYDGDGETNLEEYMRDGYDMNPANWDTDGDGLSDAFEMNYTAPSFGYSAKSGLQLNPNLWDTDGDRYSDGAEMKRYHTDPLDPTSYPRYQPMCFDAWRAPGDYDGDGRSDLSVYGVTDGNWNLMTADGQSFTLPFGNSATQPMLGDYTGDGCDDFSLFNPSMGDWHLYDAWTGQSFSIRFGDSEMIPVPADYTGDGKTDLAVYYPAEGTWFIYDLWTGQLYTIRFGGPTWLPVPGDYNSDGANDLAIYEPSTGNWNIFIFDHYRHEGQYFPLNFGGPTMIPAPGDYDGDGRNDAALFDTATANWYILTWRGQFLSGQFGCYGCIPVPGDYDGDGRTDVCVYYPPTGIWYIYCWSGQSYQVQLGSAAAMPVLKGR